MSRKIIKSIIAALTAVLAVKLAEYLHANAKISPMDIVLIAGAAGAVFGVVCEDFIVFCRRRIKFLRKELDPRSRYEGVWLIRVLDFPARPYAYATIDYNAETDAYAYRGAGFNAKGEFKASWNCPQADIDLTRNEVRFVADAQLVDTTGEVSRAYGHIQFEKKFFGRILRYSRGKGFFVDFGTQSRKAHFLLDRLDTHTIRKLIGQKQVVSHEDMAKLICAFHSTESQKLLGMQDLPGMQSA
jgi:hypothetical protein